LDLSFFLSFVGFLLFFFKKTILFSIHFFFTN